MEEKFFVIELEDGIVFKFRYDEGWRPDIAEGVLIMESTELQRSVGWPLRRVESFELT